MWQVSEMNFDNVYEAMIVLFICASGEGWPDVMFETCDITEVDYSMKRDHSEYYAYYYVIYIAFWDE